MYKYKVFVRPSSPPKPGHEEPSTYETCQFRVGLNGDEAMKFYTDLVSEDGTRIKSRRTTVSRKAVKRTVHGSTRSCSSSTRPDQVLKPSTLFYASQINDVEQVERCLNSGLDVNQADNFGWTALMCAACSGALETIKLLLHHKADKTRVNNQGRKALDLAVKKGHVEAVELLCKREKGTTEVDIPTTDSTSEILPEVQSYCRTCNCSYSDSYHSHIASITHQLHVPFQEETTHYHISEDNVGFQMMVRDGWDRNGGLGPDGKGRKFPLKTSLKPDRAGLGNKPGEKPKVTHFGPFDVQAVEVERKERPRTMRKREITKARLKEKKLEIEFRREFY